MSKIYALCELIVSDNNDYSTEVINTFPALSSARAAAHKLIESGDYTANQLVIIETTTHAVS